jgi:alpha-tubulin suppressor-like RCC1 family protein
MSIIGKKLIMSSGQNASGLLYVWGNNAAGLLGVGTPGNIPGKIDSQSWKSIALGDEHAAAIRSDGALFTWGCNGDGQLGLGDLIDRPTPTRVGTSSWTVVDAGASHSVAIAADGGLFEWGWRHGNNCRALAPTRLNTNSWSAIAAGCVHSLAVRIDGKLFAWGYNNDGQLGTGNTDYSSCPIQIGAENWQCVAASGRTSGGIRGDQRIFMWGNASYGQLGNNTISLNPGRSEDCGVCSPVQVGSDQWSHLAIGGDFAVAGIRTDNILYTWGYNRQGQLGIPGNINTAVNTTFLSAGPYGGTWKKIALSKGVGQGHGAALRSDGVLFMWGRNDFGQTGALPNVPIACQSLFINRPKQICATVGGTVSRWCDVSLGAYHTIALPSPPTHIRSWGRNNYGQLGRSTTGTADPRPNFVSTPAGLSWASVSAGTNHNLALTDFVGLSPRSIFAWGDNRYGQLGDCTTIARSCAVPVCGATGLTGCGRSIAAGANHSLAQSPSCTFSWGKNTHGQLGRTTFIDRACVPGCVTGGANINAGLIVAGGDHNLMTRLGCLFTWGRNNFGQLGNGNTNNVSAPTQIDTALGSWTFIGTGFYNSFASKGATLSGWGKNDCGQLGDGTTVTRCVPTTLTGRCAINNQQFGNDSQNQTFQGSNYGVLAVPLQNNRVINSWGGSVSELRYIQPMPVQVNASSWTCVKATSQNMIAIRNDGNVFTWGDNCSGQLGNGTFAPQPQSVSSPVQIGNIGAGCAIDIGCDRVGAINTQSSLYTWGRNTDSLLLGRQTCALTPIKLDNQKWKEVSVSPLKRQGTYRVTQNYSRKTYNMYYAGHTVAIRKDGALFAWGFNSFGQLGDSTFVKRNTPVRVTNQSWTAISAGTYHTLGIRADGALFAWGRNSSGQIGDLSTVDRCSPVQIGTQSWVNVKSGKTHSLAIRADGILFAWGSNQYGQLGNGSTISTSSPVQIGTCLWSSIESGFNSSFGITTNNSLFGWGYNRNGPICNTNCTCFSTPSQIAGAWKCVAVGSAGTISRFASISATVDTCIAVARGSGYRFCDLYDPVQAMITSANKLCLQANMDAGSCSWSWSKISIGGDTIAGIRY